MTKQNRALIITVVVSLLSATLFELVVKPNLPTPKGSNQ